MRAGFLDVRPDERATVATALLFSFLAICGGSIAIIAATTLFVQAFDLGELSRLYVVLAAGRGALSLGFGAFSQRFTGPRLPAGFLLLTGVAMVASGLLAGLGSRPLLYALCLLLQLLPPLLPVIATNAAMDCFHARQAKRLLPLVAGAATLGTMVAGGVARAISGPFGERALLYVGGAFCLAALPFPALLARRSIDAPAEAQGAKAAGMLSVFLEGFADLRAFAVIRFFALNAVLASAAGRFTDFAFFAALKAGHGGREIAEIQSTFLAVSQTVIFLTQVFVTSRFVGRFGVRAALLTRPAVLLAATPALAIAPGVASATAARFGENIGKVAVSGAVADLLLSPTPAPVRARAKVLAKAASGPVGELLAGVLLGLFGAAGPPPIAIAALLGAFSVISFAQLWGVRRAYTAALGRALGEGQVTLDVAPESAALLRAELSRMLAERVAAGDEARAADLLALMGDRLFRLDDLAPALAPSAPVEIRRAAVRAAVRVARKGEGAELLALVPPLDDPEAERALLAGARALGTAADPARAARAIARGSSSDGGEGLWAEGLIALAKTETLSALKQLHEGASGADSPRRAAALAALGEIGDRRAEAVVVRALSSSDERVFAEAARAAVLLDAPGIVTTLLSFLESGRHVRAAVRALSAAPPAAIDALLASLPTTRGEKDIHTAVAADGKVTGTARVARVLARLGPDAGERALARFSTLGYRARNALSRALAGVPDKTGRPMDPAAITAALSLSLAYAETLVAAHPGAGEGLLARELRHRIGETAERVLDLASLLGDRALVGRARTALFRAPAGPGGTRERDRGNALELLENLLPRALALRAVALLEWSPGATAASRSEGAPTFDGWLSKCRAFDAGELPSSDPMRAVLDRLMILRESSLFTGLSGEELYPVGEIAQITMFSPGNTVVREGDPGDALFVVARGTLRVVRDGKAVGELGRGGTFGEMALLDGAPRAATVEAVTDAELLRVPRGEFEALLDESPELARGVIRTLLGHIRARS